MRDEVHTHSEASVGYSRRPLRGGERAHAGVMVATRVIRWYQMARSGRPSPCRYVPTCSEYASEAIEVHGLGRGLVLSLRRISRCHPFAGHGLDPVPRGR